MRFVRDLCAVIGAVTTAMFLLGALGAGDFAMRFGAVGSIECKDKP